ncbi:MAG: integrin alpha, partial [Cyanobacteria bacterium J06560_2]
MPIFPATFDLSSLDGSNGFVINGITSNSRTGFAVSSAGDINNDGTDDFIVGAYRATPNGNSQAGESYVVFGSNTSSISSLDLSAL